MIINGTTQFQFLKNPHPSVDRTDLAFKALAEIQERK